MILQSGDKLTTMTVFLSRFGRGLHGTDSIQELVGGRPDKERDLTGVKDVSVALSHAQRERRAKCTIPSIATKT